MASVENAEIPGIVSMVTDSSNQVRSTDCVDCFQDCKDTGDCQDVSGDDEEN